jgi:thiamine transport system permease protein
VFDAGHQVRRYGIPSTDPAGGGPREHIPVLIRSAVAAGAGLAFVACLGEFGATVFLARADRPTVPVAIERLMSRPGGAGFGQAMALSCILVVICAVVLVLVDRGAGGDDGLDLSF